MNAETVYKPFQKLHKTSKQDSAETDLCNLCPHFSKLNPLNTELVTSHPQRPIIINTLYKKTETLISSKSEISSKTVGIGKVEGKDQ